jgi:ribosomal protein S18 acetylase RimI-like enzyme
MITIRRAEIKDVAYIAEGIFNAFLLEDNAIVLENRIGEGSIPLREKWMEILTGVCAQADTHYSYTNTFIAELDGEIAGMMIAVDGRNYRFQREKMYPQLKSLFDIAFGMGWEDMEDEAKAGEYYIDSLAVSLPYRNQGVGTALIEKAKEIAREKGIGVVTLAVEPENRAKRLYRQLGFGYQRRIEIFNEEYELYAAEIVV